jgi:hypothetical protein
MHHGRLKKHYFTLLLDFDGPEFDTDLLANLSETGFNRGWD